MKRVWITKVREDYWCWRAECIEKVEQ